MSSSRGAAGETSWSNCSRSTLRARTASNALKCLEDGGAGNLNEAFWDGQNGLYGPCQKSSCWWLDHDHFGGVPGRFIRADTQCGLFLKAAKAVAIDNGARRCTVLQCKYRPGDFSLFFAGPALDGTKCGGGHHCIQGKCVMITSAEAEAETASTEAATSTDQGSLQIPTLFHIQSFFLEVKTQVYLAIGICKDPCFSLKKKWRSRGSASAITASEAAGLVGLVGRTLQIGLHSPIERFSSSDSNLQRNYRG